MLRGGRTETAAVAPARTALAVDLVGLDAATSAWLPALARALEPALGCRCLERPGAQDLTFAFLPARRQFSSTAILLYLRDAYVPQETGGDGVILGVADSDITVPIFTFVFGEAIDGGPCALISGHRLKQEFYGLPPDPALFEERLLKMALHELGHTRDLRHCPAYSCVMATSYAIERVDLKSPAFCPACARAFFHHDG